MWKSAYAVRYLPLDLLAMVRLRFIFLFLIDRVPSVVNVVPFVDCSCVVVDHLHQSSGVFAQIEAVLWVLCDVPFALLALITALFDDLEEEVEQKSALAFISRVLMSSQLHHFKVIDVCLML